jgi:hypothetical protein
MKKQAYVKPAMKVVKIRQSSIICASPNGIKTLSTNTESTDPDDWHELE